jgi:hypothetical protein
LGTRDGDKSVWIIASNIFVLPTEIGILEHISGNIKKGTIYRYFMPQGYGMNPTEKELLSKFADENPGKLEIREFDDECFSAQAPADFIIFISISYSIIQWRVYLKLPIEGTEYWIQASEHAGQNFYSRFARMWKEGCPLKAGHHMLSTT